MLTKRHILSAVVAAALSLSAGSAHAQKPYKSQKPHKTHSSYTLQSLHNARRSVILEAQRSISPAEAKSIARKRVPGGEVVDISRRGDTYRVRVIAKSGKVVDVLIDANTGRVKK